MPHLYFPIIPITARDRSQRGTRAFYHSKMLTLYPREYIFMLDFGNERIIYDREIRCYLVVTVLKFSFAKVNNILQSSKKFVKKINSY